MSCFENIFDPMYEMEFCFTPKVSPLILQIYSLEALKRYHVADLKSMLGNFFSSAVTSFVRAPTEAAMVNAWRTFASEYIHLSQLSSTASGRLPGSDFGGLFNPVELLSELTAMDSGGNTKVTLQTSTGRGSGEDGRYFKFTTCYRRSYTHRSHSPTF